jgi:hypothetical protein
MDGPASRDETAGPPLGTETTLLIVLPFAQPHQERKDLMRQILWNFITRT